MLCLLDVDDSQNNTECCVTAVYDIVYRVYLYAADDRVGIKILFSLELYWGIFACPK
jgi:hypothetical protein